MKRAKLQVHCNRKPLSIIGALGLLCCPGVIAGAAQATDSAADPAYDAGWTDGSNGGSGWGVPSFGGTTGWLIQQQGGESFVGSSARGGGVGINSPPTPVGRAFGMRMNGPTGGTRQVAAERYFDGNLSPGDTFSIDMDNGALGANVHEGWGFERVVGPTTTLSFQFFADTNPGITHGVADYFVFDYAASSSHYRDTGVPITNQGVHCELTLLDPSGNYVLAITPLTAGAVTTTFGGALVVPNQLELYDVNEDPTAPADTSDRWLYFNNIGVVPDPGALAMMTCGIGTIILGRSRQPTPLNIGSG